MAPTINVISEEINLLKKQKITLTLLLFVEMGTTSVANFKEVALNVLIHLIDWLVVTRD